MTTALSNNPLSNPSLHINPYPITLKGIFTYNPQFFRLYRNGKGSPFSFVAVEEKKEGCALGAIFKKATQQQTHKKWMGKVGDPKGILKNAPPSFCTRTQREINLDTILEKLAYDLFQEFGRGLFDVPKSHLSLQPIWNPYNASHSLAHQLITNGIAESLRIMSRYIEGYNDLGNAFTLDEQQEVSFMHYLEKHHRPPEFLLTPDHKQVPLKGLMALLAVGRSLADVDLLGEKGFNAGFIWIRDPSGDILYARAVKNDPGYAFHFTHTDPKNASLNVLINTHQKFGNDYLKDDKDLQTSTGNFDAIVHWKALSFDQQEEFLGTLLNTSRYLQSEEVLSLLFYRQGKLFYSKEAEIPLEVAHTLQQDMKTWLHWQLKIYAAPLTAFKQKYPEQLLRIHYIDQFGELSLPMTLETFPIRKLFTELVIVDGKEKSETALQLIPSTILSAGRFEQDSLRETLAKLHHTSSPISLKNLFHDKQKVLLLGRAGVGKSALSQKIAHEWASGTLWNEAFDLVVWLPLRNLNQGVKEGGLLHNQDDPYDFLAHAVSHFLFKDTLPVSLLKDHLLQKKLLLILDGYDEAHPELIKKVHTLLTLPLHVLITSRPGAVALLQEKMDRIVENIGFTDSHIKTYIHQFTTRGTLEKPHETFFKTIQQNPLLFAICHNPLLLQMVLSLLEKKKDISVSSSLTPLYSLMVDEMYKWERRENLHQKEEHLRLLGEIAQVGLASQTLVIPLEKVQHLNTSSLLNAGLLKASEDRQSLFFIHLSFQEYLIAYALSKKSLKEQKAFLLDHRHHPSYQLVLAFLAGMYHQSGNINTFFALLYTDSQNVEPSSQIELTLRCLNECPGIEADIPAIRSYIATHPGVFDLKLSNGETPLIFTAIEKQTHSLKWMILQYPDLLNQENGQKVMYYCAFSGDIEGLNWLHKKNPILIKSRVNEGETLLHAAALGGRVEMMDWLINKAPCLLAMADNDDQTPLHAAAFAGHVEGMEWLHSKTPPLISKATNNGWTPFHSAALGGHVEAMEWFFTKDPTSISKATINGWTPFHSAALSGNVEAMEWLFTKDPTSITKATINGWTPFHAAAQEGNVEAMEWMLLKDPTLITKITNDGQTPLHAAAEKGHLKAMKWLFTKAPILITKAANNGWTPFHSVAFSGNVEAMEWLFTKDPTSITKATINGWTPFYAAAQEGHVEAMEWMLSKEPTLIAKITTDGMTPLHAAAQEGHVEAIKWLLSKDPTSIFKATHDGQIPFHFAALGGHVEAMEWLHAAALNLEKKSDNIEGNGFTKTLR